MRRTTSAQPARPINPEPAPDAVAHADMRVRTQTPTPSRPGRPRSGRAHEAILSAAVALIREVGYDAVAMESIAARAGVGKATLYRRWSSKELLVTEAIGRIVSTIPVPDTGSVESDVLLLMRATMEMYRDPATAALLSGLVAAMARSNRVAHAVRSGFVGRWRDVMRDVLRRGASRGELRADVDVDLAIDLLAGPLFHRYLMLGVLIDEPFTHAVVVAVLRALAAHGSAAPIAPPAPPTLRSSKGRSPKR